MHSTTAVKEPLTVNILVVQTKRQAMRPRNGLDETFPEPPLWLRVLFFFSIMEEMRSEIRPRAGGILQ